MAWYSELARRILPRPTLTPAGDKPPRYIFSFRHRPPVYNSARFAGGEPALRLIGGHILVRMTNWAPARYASKRNRPARMRGWPSTSMSQSVGMVSTWTLARQVAPVSSG